MRTVKKFIALLRAHDGEYYMQYYKSLSKRDIAHLRKNPTHRISTVMEYSERTDKKMKYIKTSLNKLNGYG